MAFALPTNSCERLRSSHPINSYRFIHQYAKHKKENISVSFESFMSQRDDVYSMYLDVELQYARELSLGSTKQIRSKKCFPRTTY